MHATVPTTHCPWCWKEAEVTCESESNSDGRNQSLRAKYLFIYILSNAVVSSCNGVEAPFYPYRFVLPPTHMHIFCRRLSCIWRTSKIHAGVEKMATSRTVRLWCTAVLLIEGLNWLLGRKSQLSLANKLLLYKCVLKPVWTYGVQLWGCAKPSHTQIIQRLQTKILRSITDAPWYVSNLTLHHDLHILFVVTEIWCLFHIYYQRLASHYNPLVTELAVLPVIAWRLKRQWPTDLINDPLYD